MAKIRSTLDIVMERTKNLAMTQEDRDALRKKELADRARGWVQLLVDRKYSVGDLQSAYREESAHSPALRDILRRELLDHVDPDADNGGILEALREVLGLDDGPVLEAISAYRDDAEHAMQESRERIMSSLAASGIAGSAVLPNVQVDPEWAALTGRMKEGVRKSLQGYQRYLNQ